MYDIYITLLYHIEFKSSHFPLEYAVKFLALGTCKFWQIHTSFNFFFTCLNEVFSNFTALSHWVGFFEAWTTFSG